MVQQSLFPIQHQRLWDLYKQACSSFWVTDEVDLSGDKGDLEKLSAQERKLLMRVLAFFSCSDIIVNDNLVCNFYQELDVPECKQFWAFQMGVEAVHSEQYALLIDTYATAEEKPQLFNGIESFPSIRAKADFCRRYMDTSYSLPLRIVAYACVEGVLFSSSFAVIYWLKKRGLCPGLTLSNEFISRDEGLHASFACEVFRTLLEKQSDLAVHTIVREAVEAECAFVSDNLDISVLGLNADSMCTYVRYIADRLLFELGHPKLYHVANPLEYMDMIALQTKANFFESRVSEYKKAVHDHTFSTDAEF